MTVTAINRRPVVKPKDVNRDEAQTFALRTWHLTPYLGNKTPLVSRTHQIEAERAADGMRKLYDLQQAMEREK
jgi:hypothetical protein